jgi:polyisoprenoid-binding protein YceI
MRKIFFAVAALALISLPVSAANYVIDDKGAHAFINFKIKHLGYSWLTGRFNTFTGKFNYDADNVSDTNIVVDINTSSFDSNHAERDRHIKGPEFLNAPKFGAAKFVSTQVVDKGNNQLEVVGDFTLLGVTKTIVIDAEKIGEGKDPWGGYRAGFAGTARIGLKDFGISESLGPASTHVYLELHIEGIRQ